MTHSYLLLLLAVLVLLAFWLGERRSLSLVGGNRGIRNLHSLPYYYGMLTALWCALPALLVMAVWLMFQDRVLTALISAHFPGDWQALSAGERGLLVNEIHNVVAGQIDTAGVRPQVMAAAAEYRQLQGIANLALAGLVLVIAVAGLGFAHRQISPTLRARNAVERIFEWLLLACSTIAVFVTIGIVEKAKVS